MSNKLGVHESIEIHELVTFKSLCLTKATIMQGLVTDENLKNIMKQDATMHEQHLKELNNHLNQ